MSAAELSPVPREARPYQGETAGVVTRSVANVVDAIVVWAMVAACYLGLVAVKFLLDPRTFTWPEGNFLAGLTFTLSLSVVYLWLSWWLWGRSYGKHVMGIRVAGRRGRRLGPVRALGRAAFCVFFPIGFFWCAISPRRHSIQDIAVYSAVTYDWMPHPVGGAAPVVQATGAQQSPPPGEPPAEASPTESKAQSRRYRWARTIDPYED
ncbi:MAG TPA: RDD family protein [Ornithinibacter sp.]|nr:RDD family protein [Ornithinibacter sp.]